MSRFGVCEAEESAGDLVWPESKLRPVNGYGTGPQSSSGIFQALRSSCFNVQSANEVGRRRRGVSEGRCQPSESRLESPNVAPPPLQPDVGTWGSCRESRHNHRHHWVGTCRAPEFGTWSSELRRQLPNFLRGPLMMSCSKQREAILGNMLGTPTQLGSACFASLELNLGGQNKMTKTIGLRRGEFGIPVFMHQLRSRRGTFTSRRWLSLGATSHWDFV